MGVATVLTGSMLVLLGTCAAEQVLFNSTAYGDGDLGPAPSQNFTSAPGLQAPVFNIKDFEQDQLAEGHLMFAWAGNQVARTAPIIFDSNGTLLWIHPNETESSDFKMQSYQGEKVLSYFHGEFLGGHGQGYYSIMNASYDIIRDVGYIFDSMGEQPMADIHDFAITNNDTFLSVSWGYPVQTDLSSIGGPEDGWTFDCLFQEVDFDGNVLFNFSSLEHGIPVSETLFSGPGDDVAHDNPYDYCHINSIQKDDDGSYLMSMRGPSTVYKIGQDGQVAWRIAYNSSISDFDMDDNTKFIFQHDARWLNDSSTNPRYMSVFDNHGIAGFDANDVARGIILIVDTEAMTVKLAAEYPSSMGVFAAAQGSVQVLPNGNTLVGYGFQPHVSEFTADGEMLYDAYFGPDNSTGPTVLAYRTFRSDWIGLPRTQPNFVIDNSDGTSRAFVSWNGATEVASWMFATGDNATSLQPSTGFARTGFETNTTLPEDSASYIAVVALDGDGSCLGVSMVQFSDDSESSQEGNCDSIAGLDTAELPDTSSNSDDSSEDGKRASTDDDDGKSSATVARVGPLAVACLGVGGLLAF